MYDVYAMMMRELQRFEEAGASRRHHDRFTPRRRTRRSKRRHLT